MPAVSSFTPPAIEVEALVKTYGEVEAVRGVSFTVARGEVFGFLGPNGAGKSTTINMLCTLARPTSGTARVSGFDVVARARRRPPAHRPRVPGPDARRPPHRRRRTSACTPSSTASTAGAIPARMDQMLEMVDLWPTGATSR